MFVKLGLEGRGFVFRMHLLAGLPIERGGISAKGRRAIAGPRSGSQASHDLARLRGNGLIERIARTNTCRLTADGLTFALVYSRVHDHLLYPLTARMTSRSRLLPRSAPPGGPSPGTSTAPSPPPASGARPEPLPSLPKLGSTVKVLAPQSARAGP